MVDSVSIFFEGLPFCFHSICTRSHATNGAEVPVLHVPTNMCAVPFHPFSPFFVCLYWVFCFFCFVFGRWPSCWVSRSLSLWLWFSSPSRLVMSSAFPRASVPSRVFLGNVSVHVLWPGTKKHVSSGAAKALSPGTRPPQTHIGRSGLQGTWDEEAAAPKLAEKRERSRPYRMASASHLPHGTGGDEGATSPNGEETQTWDGAAAGLTAV